MDNFYIKHNNLIKKISFDSLLWIKADGNYSMVHVDNAQYVIKIPLKRIVAQLPTTHFCQIHRAYGVSLRRIENIDVTNSELTVNEEKLPIGRNYRDALLASLAIIK